MFSVDWSVFNEPALLDDNSWLIYILNGLGWTVSLAAASFMLALVAGILIGTASTLKNRPILHHGLGRTFPQHSAHRSNLSLVLRHPGIYSADENLDD